MAGIQFSPSATQRENLVRPRSSRRAQLGEKLPENSRRTRMDMDVAVSGSETQKEGAGEPERKPLPYLFEKELIDNGNKHIHIFKTFVPINRVAPLEGKFYARHEQTPPSCAKFLPYTELGNHGGGRLRTDAKPIAPRLESHVYGWLQKSLTIRDLAQLNFVVAPKQRCDMTTYGERLIGERHTERPGFNGLRFFLR